jgi:hypothetical protein
MKKMFLVMLALCMFVCVVGCATLTSPVVNSIDIKSTDFSKSMKTGEACRTYVLCFIGPFGDASIVQAAQEAKISKVEAVDYKSGWYFLFSKYCVRVYGE